ncbi:MAG TPA: regulatory protein RecX [Candidatus Dormibacteraeota bacterium]
MSLGRGGRQAKPAVPRQPESADDAYEEAVRRLARQPQSRAMLEGRLRQAGYAGEAIAAALDRAQGAGYLSDREFAESLVRRRGGIRGSAMIAQELRASGIDEATAEPALAGLDREAEFENAVKVGRKVLGGRRFSEGQALLAYLGPKLARRGFAGGVVYRACRLLAAEWQAEGLFDTDLEQN